MKCDPAIQARVSTGQRAEEGTPHEVGLGCLHCWDVCEQVAAKAIQAMPMTLDVAWAF